MIIKQLSPTEFTEIYNTYMIKDFPETELKPLERILDTMRTGLCSTYGIFEGEGSQEQTLRGYAVFIIPQDLAFGLLDYLAILSKYRGSGIGQRFFAEIPKILSHSYPQLQGFFIETEDVEYAPDETQRQIREKRNSFYDRCGCLPAQLGSCLFGVTYTILYFTIANRENSSKPSKSDLDDVYLKMFKKHHYENQVALWET